MEKASNSNRGVFPYSVRIWLKLQFIANRDAKELLRYLLRFTNMENLLKRMQSFWKQYNRGATIEATRSKEEGGRKNIVLTVWNYDLGSPGCSVLAEYMRVLCLNTGANELEKTIAFL